MLKDQATFSRPPIVPKDFFRSLPFGVSPMMSFSNPFYPLSPSSSLSRRFFPDFSPARDFFDNNNEGFPAMVRPLFFLSVFSPRYHPKPPPPHFPLSGLPSPLLFFFPLAFQVHRIARKTFPRLGLPRSFPPQLVLAVLTSSSLFPAIFFFGGVSGG